MNTVRVTALALLNTGMVFAHHGIASLGYASLHGPGAPLETSTSFTLPQSSWLFYMKLDNAKFRTYTPQRDQEVDLYQFWFFGLGYGIRSWLSAYVFLPYSYKKDENNQFNTAGFADPLISLVFGFKYDEGFRLIPARESLDELQDWHFTLYTNVSVPVAEDDLRDSEGNIDPVKGLGYGKPTINLGATATKMLGERLTLISNLSYLKFYENSYGDGLRYKFGDEVRFDIATTYTLAVRDRSKFRVDSLLELNFLNIERDEENGKKLTGSGGKILYTTLGFRFFYKDMSLGVGVKLPLWKKLNEEQEQQGSEGLEKYRAIITLSFLF